MNKADIERHILEGPTLKVAISVDTCIYQQHGFRLESGQLRHLEQFSGTAGIVVMSDVVQREVLAHMVTEAVKAKCKPLAHGRRSANAERHSRHRDC